MFLSRERLKLPQLLKSMDWSFIRGSAIISIGMLLARLLGLGFSLILARVFAPEAFGQIQYTLAVAGVLAIVIHPFGQHVIAKFISSLNGNSEGATGIGATGISATSSKRHSGYSEHGEHDEYNEANDLLERTLNNAWLLFLLLFGLTVMATSIVAWLSPDLGFELVAVVSGIALFYAYWGVSRGYIRPGHLTAAYLGSNVVQLVAVGLLIWLMEIRSTKLALTIYGLSYLPVILYLQRSFPLALHITTRLKHLQRKVLRELIRFTVPVALSHAAFMLFVAADLLFLKPLVDADAVGRYALAKTLATAFSFVPMGIATLLMPQVASTQRAKRKSLLVFSLLASLTINLLLLAGYWILVGWFVRSLFGEAYLASPILYLVLAFSAMMLGIQSIIAAVFVGSNQPEIETAGRIVATIFVVVGCWLLIPHYGEMGAAISVLIASVAAIIMYALLAFRRTKMQGVHG